MQYNCIVGMILACIFVCRVVIHRLYSVIYTDKILFLYTCFETMIGANLSLCEMESRYFTCHICDSTKTVDMLWITYFFGMMIDCKSLILKAFFNWHDFWIKAGTHHAYIYG